MSNNKKRSITIILILVVVSAAIFILTKTMKEQSSEQEIVLTPSPEAGQPTNSETNNVVETSTIADKWQWQETNQQTTSNANVDEEESLPFTAQSVHDALQAVKLDENGDVILDHDALISLDEALERIYNRLDNDSLFKLQDLIKEALPGKVGEQTAQLVEDYQGFLKAKEQFSQIHKGAANASAVQTVASIESDQALYGELQELREIHLGQQTANSLFHDSDANAEFMFDSIKLGLDSCLSAEEVEARRAEIQNRLNQQLGNSTN